MTGMRSGGFVVALLAAVAVARAAAAAAPIRIDVTFLDDGRCSVTASART